MKISFPINQHLFDLVHVLGIHICMYQPQTKTTIISEELSPRMLGSTSFLTIREMAMLKGYTFSNHAWRMEE
jgi:hypothetical protein